MNKKLAFIIASVLVIFIVAGIITAIFVNRNKNNNTEIDKSNSISEQSDDQSTTNSIIPDSQEISSLSEQSTVSEKTEISSSEWEKLKLIISSMYFANFENTDNLSEKQCLSYLESIINAQDMNGNAFMINTQKNSEGNYISKEDGDKIILELFGRKISSDNSFLTNDKKNYLFMYAGGSGLPETTLQQINFLGNNRFQIICTLKRTNAANEIIMNDSFNITVEYIGGEYSDYRFLSLQKAAG